MANLGPYGFDANQHQPHRSSEPLRPGRYLAAIVASEMKPTRAGDGEYLELRFEIVESEHRGRCVFTRLNLRNPNPQAERIAQTELAAICRAVGILRPRDSLELHDIPLLVDVSVRTRSDTGEPTNAIRSYRPREKREPERSPSHPERAPWES